MCFCLGTAIAGASAFWSATLRMVHKLIPSPHPLSLSRSPLPLSSKQNSCLYVCRNRWRWFTDRGGRGSRSEEFGGTDLFSNTYAEFSDKWRAIFRVGAPRTEALPRIHGLVDRMVRYLPCSRWQAAS